MIVVDTNIIAYLCLEELNQQQLAEQVLQQDPRWMAPALWRSEFRNILLQYHKAKGLTCKQSQALYELMEKIVQTYNIPLDSNEVLDLAFASKCSAYDCEFVALAKKLNVPLVTADRQILKAFPETALSLKSFRVKR